MNHHFLSHRDRALSIAEHRADTANIAREKIRMFNAAWEGRYMSEHAQRQQDNLLDWYARLVGPANG